MAQDSRGFMWFGTPSGLCRYDGYTFKLYDPTPIFAYTTMHEDRHGSLWYTASGQIHRLDLATEKMTRYSVGSGISAQIIFEDSGGDLWVTTRHDGLARYVPSADSFVSYTHNPLDSTSICTDTINALCEDRWGDLWVGTPGGMDRLEKETGKFVHCKHVSMNMVFSIIEDEKGFLWLGTNDGLCVFDPIIGQFDRHKSIQVPRNVTESIYLTSKHELWLCLDNRVARFDRSTARFDFVRGSPPDTTAGVGGYIPSYFFEDRQGRLWVSTFAGLALFDRTNHALALVKPRPKDPGSMAEGYLTGMMEDRGGIIWFATGNSGVCMLDDTRPSFVHVGNDPYGKVRLTHASVCSILEDRSGMLWVGSEHGLDRISPSTGKKEHFDYDMNDTLALPGRTVWDIVDDGQDVLWLGTSRGICRLDKRSERFTRFPHHAAELGIPASQRVMSICIDRSGAMWLGGGVMSGLLMKFDRTSGRFTNYLFPDPQGFRGEHAAPIFQVYESSSGLIWFTGYLGYCFNTGAGKMRRHSGDTTLSNCTSICEDASGGLWMGLERGLACLDSVTGAFHLVPSGELEDETILEIVADKPGLSRGERDPGDLWLLTGKGLSRFTPATGAIRKYGPAEGVTVAAADFVHSSFKNHNGDIYFGGTNGFVKLHPDSVRENTRIPPVFVTSFKKFNVEAELDSAVAAKKVIELSYDEGVVSFEFAALNFVRPQKNQYAYKLEGFDRDWVYCGTRRTTMYTNLEPGTYVFRVKGSNNEGVWNEAGTSMRLTVLPPYWRTWWFRLVAVSALVAVLLVAYRRKVSQLENDKRAREHFSRQQIESQDLARKRLAAELHDGLAQDLLVAGNELQRFLCEGNNGTREELTQAASLIQESVQAVREISSNLHPHHLDRLGFVSAIEAMTENLARATGLCIHTSLERLDGRLRKETEIHLYRIIQEALTNVVRHAHAKNVEVKVREERGTMDMVIVDDGEGFQLGEGARSQKPVSRAEGLSGFGLASMSERARIIGATLHIESSPGSGTVVRVTVPLSSP